MITGPSVITSAGYKRLKDEYEALTGPERKVLVERIRAAREQGDLSENAAYASAKEDQAFAERRILELRNLLQSVEVVEHSGQCARVGVGCQVKLTIEAGRGGAEEQEFQIVGVSEADPAQWRISHNSPLGKALLGGEVGDAVKLDTAVGTVVYTIAEID